MDCRDVVVDRFKQSLSTNRESLVEGRENEKKTIRVNAGENDDFAGAFHCLEVKVFQSLDEMLWQLTSQWLSLSESSLSANRRGEMSDFSSSSTCTLIGIIQIARHASRVGGWDCPSGGKMIGLRRRTEKKMGGSRVQRGALWIVVVVSFFFPFFLVFISFFLFPKHRARPLSSLRE